MTVPSKPSGLTNVDISQGASWFVPGTNDFSFEWPRNKPSNQHWGDSRDPEYLAFIREQGYFGWPAIKWLPFNKPLFLSAIDDVTYGAQCRLIPNKVTPGDTSRSYDPEWNNGLTKLPYPEPRLPDQLFVPIHTTLPWDSNEAAKALAHLEDEQARLAEIAWLERTQNDELATTAQTLRENFNEQVLSLSSSPTSGGDETIESFVKIDDDTTVYTTVDPITARRIELERESYQHGPIAKVYIQRRFTTGVVELTQWPRPTLSHPNATALLDSTAMRAAGTRIVKTLTNDKTRDMPSPEELGQRKIDIAGRREFYGRNWQRSLITTAEFWAIQRAKTTTLAIDPDPDRRAFRASERDESEWLIREARSALLARDLNYGHFLTNDDGSAYLDPDTGEEVYELDPEYAVPLAELQAKIENGAPERLVIDGWRHPRPLPKPVPAPWL